MVQKFRLCPAQKFLSVTGSIEVKRSGREAFSFMGDRWRWVILAVIQWSWQKEIISLTMKYEMMCYMWRHPHSHQCVKETITVYHWNINLTDSCVMIQWNSVLDNWRFLWDPRERERERERLADCNLIICSLCL